MRRASIRCRPKLSAGQISIFRDGSRTFARRCTSRAARSGTRCGSCSAASPTAARRPTASWRRSRPASAAGPQARLARKRGWPASAAGPQARPSQMSAQAVGGAVGKNKPSILVPCRRIVGANGSLTGCAGGIEKKIRLLEPEGAMRNTFFVPKKSAGAYPERKRPPRGVYPRGGLFQTLQNSDLIQSTRL